ncbi:SET domain-containing protein [Peniophora sp. CONT]|nr:SET domain-containing protein [Peniophora sp. CONT]
MEPSGTSALNPNILPNTTYKPVGPTPDDHDFEPTRSFDRTRGNSGARRIDYEDSDYILTTLPSQKEGIDRDGETECFCTGWFRRTVLSTPGFPSPIVYPKKVVYEVREVEGCGLGVFALEDIRIGDLIVAERPLIVNMIVGDMERVLEALCARMSSETFKTYMALHNCYGTDDSGSLTGIMLTNGFSTRIDEPSDPAGGTYSCTGAVASRFNHSCSPNAVHTFHLPSFAMEVHALQPIAKGEEIVVNYTSIEPTAEARQVSLKPYNFVCTCLACKNSATSDIVRAKAVSSLLPKTSQGVQHAEGVLAAYEATGLHLLPRYIDLLERVAKINRKKGNTERADELDLLADTIIALQSRSLVGKGSGSSTGIQLKSPQDALNSLKIAMQYAGSDSEREDLMRIFKQALNLGSQN